MMLTPRQMAAYLEFSHHIERIERANTLTLTAIGAQGDKQLIEKTLKDLGR